MSARLSVSSWSLHRALGPRYQADPNTGQLVADSPTPGALTLLELPSQIAGRGIKTLEVCHFHFPHLDQGYLDEFRAACSEAGVELFSILIDAGDITHPNPAERAENLEWIQGWLEIAGRCGAGHARVIAGKIDIEPQNGQAKEHPAIRLSAENLQALARFGRDHGVRVITENFQPLAKRPEQLLAILDLCEGKVGLCADFGNFHGPAKYEDLAAILPHADSVHAKAHYPQAGEMERADFVRCMELSHQASFSGPYSLIFDGPGSEWDSLEEIKAVVEGYTEESRGERNV
jgi:sugar phosphate isomerase/epimerase